MNCTICREPVTRSLGQHMSERHGQTEPAGTSAVRDRLRDRAEWYSREARRLMGQGEQERANLRGAIASELREIAESL